MDIRPSSDPSAYLALGRDERWRARRRLARRASRRSKPTELNSEWVDWAAERCMAKSMELVDIEGPTTRVRALFNEASARLAGRGLRIAALGSHRHRRGGGRPRAASATSRSSGGGSSGDPDEPEPGESTRRSDRHLAFAPPPKAIYTFGCPTPEQRGEETA